MLQLSRNFLEGETNALEQATQLQTVLLNRNYLTCTAARLDHSPKLAIGNFTLPTAAVAKRFQQDLKQHSLTQGQSSLFCSKALCIHMTSSVSVFDKAKLLEAKKQNIALVFAGNPGKEFYVAANCEVTSLM